MRKWMTESRITDKRTAYNYGAYGIGIGIGIRGAAARHARGQTSGQWETDGPRPVLTSRQSLRRVPMNRCMLVCTINARSSRLTLHGGQRSSRAVVAQQHSLTHRRAHTPDMTLNATLSKRRGSNRVEPPRLVAPRPVVRLWLRAHRAEPHSGWDPSESPAVCHLGARSGSRPLILGANCHSLRQVEGVGSAAASLRARCA
eukprot:scaffold1694_cov126-Isochrysis_galbana.AAC.4